MSLTVLFIVGLIEFGLWFVHKSQNGRIHVPTCAKSSMARVKTMDTSRATKIDRRMARSPLFG